MTFKAKFQAENINFKASFGNVQQIPANDLDDGYEQGYQNGYQTGYADGENTGYKNGYDIGKADGLTEGESIGYSKGYDIGYKEGYEKGYEIGIEESFDVGYQKGISRTNLYHKSGNVPTNQNNLTIEYNEETQAYTINGTTNTGFLIQLSNNMDLEWEIGRKYYLARFLESGEIVLEGSAYLLWSIFTMNNSSFMGGRVTEKAENVNTGVLYAVGTAIAPSKNDGFKQYIQTLGTGTVTFNNAVVRMLVVPEEDSIRPWIPYVFPISSSGTFNLHRIEEATATE